MNQFFIHKKRDYSGRVLTPLKKREPTSSTFYLVASDEERHDLFGIAYDGRNIYDFVHSDDIEAFGVWLMKFVILVFDITPE